MFSSSCFYCISLDKRGKFSRKRLNEDEGDITYINEHNRVFNKKVRVPTHFQPVTSADELYVVFPRLHGITTSIRKKLEIALNVERPYRIDWTFRYLIRYFVLSFDT